MGWGEDFIAREIFLEPHPKYWQIGFIANHFFNGALRLDGLGRGGALVSNPCSRPSASKNCIILYLRTFSQAKRSRWDEDSDDDEKFGFKQQQQYNSQVQHSCTVNKCTD